MEEIKAPTEAPQENFTSDTAVLSAYRHPVYSRQEDRYEPKVFKFCYRPVSCVTMMTLQEEAARRGEQVAQAVATGSQQHPAGTMGSMHTSIDINGIR